MKSRWSIYLLPAEWTKDTKFSNIELNVEIRIVHNKMQKRIREIDLCRYHRSLILNMINYRIKLKFKILSPSLKKVKIEQRKTTDKCDIEWSKNIENKFLTWKTKFSFQN